MGTYFKGIEERNITTVRLKNMEAVTWVFPSPGKLHCSSKVSFQCFLWCKTRNFSIFFLHTQMTSW